MGPFDSGADVAWLSQYPHEKEILLPPLVFHEVKSIETAKSPYEIPLLHVRSRLRVPSMMLTQPLLTSEEQHLWKQVPREDRGRLEQVRRRRAQPDRRAAGGGGARARALHED